MRPALNSYTPEFVPDKQSTLISRNITVIGRRTSVRLEPEMWEALREISIREGCRIHDICSLISMRKSAGTSLTAAIRVFLMLYFRASSTEQGHDKAGHGNFERMRERARVDVIPKSPFAHHTNHEMKGSEAQSIPEARIGFM